MSPDRAARKVETVTGCILETIYGEHNGKHVPVAYTAEDPELQQRFLVAVKGRTDAASVIAIHRIHAMIYKARRERLYELQGGRCGKCSFKTDRLTCHHKKHRGAHGRDDRMQNLILLGSGPGSCGCHEQEHGTKVQP